MVSLKNLQKGINCFFPKLCHGRGEKIAVVLPAYNEEDVIVPNTLRLYEFLQEQQDHYDIIISDNNSTDGTTRLPKTWSQTE